MEKNKNIIFIVIIIISSCSSEKKTNSSNEIPMDKDTNSLNTEHIKKNNEKNNSDSLYRLGLEILTADTNVTDIDLAKECLYGAVELQNIDALTLIGCDIVGRNSIFYENDLIKWINLLEEAEALGSDVAIECLAEFYFKSGYVPRAIKLYERVDLDNNIDAAFSFGFLLVHGNLYGENDRFERPEIIDIERGIDILITAANKGSGLASYVLGYIFLYGNDAVKVDSTKSLFYFEMGLNNPMFGGSLKDNIEITLENEFPNYQKPHNNE